MALNITDTTYAGTFASYFWVPATFSMDTISKGVCFVQDGIKKEHTIGRVDFSTPLQQRAATPVSSGTFTIDGRVLYPKDMMVYTEFNPRDFEVHWEAEALSPTLLARELPLTVENYMMQIALNRTFEQIENCLWQGSTTYTAPIGSTGNGQLKFFDGFLKKMVNDSGVLQYSTGNGAPYAASTLITGATDSTHTNIVDAFNFLITLAATNKKALLTKATRYDRMKFLVSINTQQIYQTYLTVTLGFKGVNTTDRGIDLYKGYSIVPLAGLPDDTIVFCEAIDEPDGNLYVGMNSTEDNNLQLQRVSNPSELFFFKGLMKYDVQYGFSEQVFLFTTKTSSSFNA